MSGFEKLVRFLAAIPVVSAAFGTWSVLIVMLFNSGSRQIGPGNALVVVAFSFLFGSPFVAVMLAVVAFPTTLLLDLIGVHGWRAYALAGMVVGGLSVFALLRLTVGFRPPDGFNPSTGTIGLVPGLVGGLYWWWVVDWHHDHRSRIVA